MATTTVDPIVQTLNSLVEKSPDLKETAQLYARLLPLLRDAALHAAPIPLTADQARAKLEAGEPLLHQVELTMDYDAARKLMIDLARALEEPAPEGKTERRQWSDALRSFRSGRGNSARSREAERADAADLYERARQGDQASLRAAAAQQIRSALEGGQVDMADLLSHVTANDGEYVAAFAQQRQLDPGLVWTLAQNVCKPALREWRQQLEPLVSQQEWDKGYCYVCGALATIGELQGNEQVRHLRCSQCGADWPFRHIRCIYCGNDDHRLQNYIYPEGERDRLRVETCDHCHGYFKVIAAFSPTPPDLLPIRDLETLHLDYIAQGRGYTRTPEL